MPVLVPRYGQPRAGRLAKELAAPKDDVGADDLVDEVEDVVTQRDLQPAVRDRLGQTVHPLDVRADEALEALARRGVERLLQQCARCFHQRDEGCEEPVLRAAQDRGVEGKVGLVGILETFGGAQHAVMGLAHVGNRIAALVHKRTRCGRLECGPRLHELGAHARCDRLFAQHGSGHNASGDDGPAEILCDLATDCHDLSDNSHLWRRARRGEMLSTPASRRAD